MKNSEVQHGLYFAWEGQRGSERRSIRISKYGSGKGSIVARTNYPKMVSRVRQAWGLDRPSREWRAVQQWRDFLDWRSLIGSKSVPFQPSVVVEISANEIPFFQEAFRFGSTSAKDAARSVKIGQFLAFVFDKLPAIGEPGTVVVVRDPFSEDSQIFWLGVVLQGRRVAAGQ